MALSYPQKERYDISDLRALMTLLRSPEGCPWDRAQTHESICSSMLEETHEAIEAIRKGDLNNMCEELGDMLLQVVFHAEIARESGNFDFDNVVDGICKKLLVRHPHVFGDVTAGDEGAALRAWDAVKRQTKGDVGSTELLRSVPRTLPALMRAGKVEGRAARAVEQAPGRDAWLSRAEELLRVIRRGDAPDRETAYGELLWCITAAARREEIDAEQALSVSTDAFIERFAACEGAE